MGQPLVDHTGTVMCVATSTNGCRVVSGSDDVTVRVWNVKGEEAIKQPDVSHTIRVSCVAMNTSERRVVSGSDDGTIKFGTPRTGKWWDSRLSITSSR